MTASSPQPDACSSCLRRAYLVGHLAPRIAGLIGGGRSRCVGLLSLPESELIAAAGGRDRAATERFLDAFDAKSERTRLLDSGVEVRCRHADGYPAALLQLDDPPSVLFASGRGAALKRLADEPAVAIVGSRSPSPYGQQVAYELSRGLAAAGVPVVSGLALGVDATAHRGCLDGGGVPIAVVASGPDVVYPRRHRGLRQSVLGAGCVVSELPPGTPVYRWSFPARNRIMAALARMTLVVEAADPSGSLITADFARDLGRAVGAVPGRINARVAQGSNALLRDGAAPITSAQDVLDELFGAGVRELPHADRPELGDSALRAVLAAVEAGRPVSEIARVTRLPVGRVRAALGQLEAGGLVSRLDLGSWERALP
jgi:DNA processing protein